ncbi:MAG: hypothetical protein IJC74_03975 [Clostridia bacterium]|nr:hypothetical protein [Clostridia bacterium]
MKKTLKKILSSTITAAMLLTMAFVPTYALDDAIGAIGFDNLTLSEHDGSIASIATATDTAIAEITDSANFGGFTNVKGSNLSSANGGVTIEAGNFGKPADDKVVHLWRPSGVTAGDAGQGILIGHEAQRMSEGEYTEIEVYMAWDGTSSDTKGIVGYYTLPESITNGTDGKAGRHNCPDYVLYVDGSGKLTVLNEATGVTLTPNKWHKINLVMKSGKGGTSTTAIDGKTGTADIWSVYPVTDASMNTNAYSLYIDNAPVIENKVFTPEGNIHSKAESAAQFGGYQWGNKGYFDEFLGFYQLIAEVRTSANNTATTGVWLDDLSYSNGLDNAPVYSNDVSFTLKDTASDVAKLYKDVVVGSTQYIDSRVDPNDFLLNGEELGIEKTSLADGESVNLWTTNAAGEKLSPAIVNTSTTRAALNCSGTRDIGFGFKSSATPTYAVTEPLGGVSDNGYAIVNSNTDVAWAEIEDVENTDYVSKKDVLPYTVEASFLFDGNFRYFSFGMQSIEGGWWSFAFRNDGTIAVNNRDDFVIGRYQKGQWVRVSTTYYMTAKKAEVYVDGVSLGCFDTNCSSINRVKWPFYLAKDAETGNVAAAKWAVDEIHKYNGSRRSAETEPALDLTSDTLTIGKSAIFIPTTADRLQDNFFAALNTTNGDIENAKIFTDSTLTEENDGVIKTGNILVISRNLDHNSKAYSYYYLVAGAANDLSIESVSETLSAGSHKDVTANINFYKPVSKFSQLLICQYKGDELVGISKALIPSCSISGHSLSEYEYPVTHESEFFDIDVIEGATIRAFAVESANSMKPYAQAKKLN